MNTIKTNWGCDMEEFHYDDNETYEANFSTWFSMNTQERRLHNEEPYTEQIAKRVFNEMHGRKALNNIEDQIGKFFTKEN
jgi:hypothetical protein